MRFLLSYTDKAGNEFLKGFREEHEMRSFMARDICYYVINMYRVSPY